ncbi:hypothetical protein AB6A40_004479 [Gnathostoma spinigerum]|uniref:NADH dehydrogenase subunit 4L n=1 Tax=Gnathostoma spinigerum TaxID=75299 RepID=A0ABD6EDR3_9BILA
MFCCPFSSMKSFIIDVLSEILCLMLWLKLLSSAALPFITVTIIIITAVTLIIATSITIIYYRGRESATVAGAANNIRYRRRYRYRRRH